MTGASGGPRVLLVDDDAKMVDLVRGILTDDGYDVVGVTTSLEALRHVAEAPFDVVVVDRLMPDRDGLDLAEDIRSSRPDQPIVIFSSLFDLRLDAEARGHGFRYVEKADGIDALERALREVARR